MNRDTFPVVILIGRPAAGKSEVIDYLKHLPDDERRERLYLAPLVEIDDFIWVWQIFEDDNIRDAMGRERQNSTSELYFTDPFVWDFLIGKINLEFDKDRARDPRMLSERTVLVEFARGGGDAFRHALDIMSDEILSRAVLVYVRVSYDESLRRNRQRARKGQEDSILYHSLPDEKMETYYKTNDWEVLSGGKPSGILQIRGHSVPFAVFQNEPEVTDDPMKLGRALADVFGTLWSIKQQVIGKTGGSGV